MTLLARVLIFYPGQRAGILEEITHLTRQCMDRRNSHELDSSLWFFPQFIFLPVLNSSVDQLLLAVINWPKTKTLRQQLAVSTWWCIWFDGYCRAIDDVWGCHVNVLSPPCYLEGAAGPESLSLGGKKSSSLPLGGEKSSPWPKTKPSLKDTLGLQFGTLWESFWIPESATTSTQLHRKVRKIIFWRWRIQMQVWNGYLRKFIN